MNSIISKRQLSDDVFELRVEAPLIAEERKPGQFIIFQLDTDFGERVPLTIADADPDGGTITLIFQTVGNTTHRLAALEEGDSIENLLGPLGTPTHLENFGHVVCVGGGIGVAPMHPIAQGMKQAGNKVISILGARSKDLIFWEEELRRVSDELIVTTDDGSYERKGFVTDVLVELLKKHEKDNLIVYAIGPVPMMAKVAEVTKSGNIKTIVSLNPIMVDATGMCGSCRVTVNGETKFGCVDGPEFDAHQVDFKELMERLVFFKQEEECLNNKCPRK